MKAFEAPHYLTEQWVASERQDEPGGPVAGPAGWLRLLTARAGHARRVELERSWAELLARHDETLRKWSAYELDVAKLIDYPAMSDMREPQTVAMIRALKAAERLRPANPRTIRDAADGSEYARAVAVFEDAFTVAEMEAQRIRRGHFTVVEQERLRLARQLLNVAQDEGSSAAERQGAYRQLRQAVADLIVLPDRALAALETGARAGG